MKDAYVHSGELLIIKQRGLHRWTTHPKRDDFAVWYSNKIVAQGGREMTERVFMERSECSGKP
jgi:hypothetical protein